MLRIPREPFTKHMHVPRHAGRIITYRHSSAWISRYLGECVGLDEMRLKYFDEESRACEMLVDGTIWWTSFECQEPTNGHELCEWNTWHWAQSAWQAVRSVFHGTTWQWTDSSEEHWFTITSIKSVFEHVEEDCSLVIVTTSHCFG